MNDDVHHATVPSSHPRRTMAEEMCAAPLSAASPRVLPLTPVSARLLSSLGRSFDGLSIEPLLAQPHASVDEACPLDLMAAIEEVADGARAHAQLARGARMTRRPRRVHGAGPLHRAAQASPSASSCTASSSAWARRCPRSRCARARARALAAAEAAGAEECAALGGIDTLAVCRAAPRRAAPRRTARR